MKNTGREFEIEVLRACVESFAGRLMTLASDISDKTIHETRVESRRLRVALESFQQMFPGAAFNSACKAVRRITHILGQPRETAVWLDLIDNFGHDGGVKKFCLEYLRNRLGSRLKKQELRLKKRLGYIDPFRIRAPIDLLISAAESNRGNRAVTGSSQLSLFELSESAAAKSCRALKRFTTPILEFNAEQQLQTASDKELHSLRIAAKKMRYCMEIFSPAWPGGLMECIEKARRFQDAGGRYNDWSGLGCFLGKEIKRLDSNESVRIAFELGRLAEQAELRKAGMKTLMNETLVELQRGLHKLHRTGRLLAANPNLSPMNVMSSGIRRRNRPKSKRTAKSLPNGISAA